MTVEEATNEVKQLIETLLRERFKDEIEFGPIVVMPRFDHDGEEYLRSYIVFKGDQEKLDPTWTLRLSRKLWPLAEKHGYTGIPIQLFVEKSEWPDLEEHLV